MRPVFVLAVNLTAGLRSLGFSGVTVNAENGFNFQRFSFSVVQRTAQEYGKEISS
jgi:hypothetical protein